ncbi:MAG: ROK family protein [Chloroflexi bacterium]|nr:ROK family protein [Chloroflexota bacterium]
MTSAVPLYVGIDVGGTKTLAVVGDATGRMLGRAVNPSQADQRADVIVDVIVQTAREAVANAGVESASIRGAGIAAAGAVDPQRGMLVSCPQMPQIADAPLVSMFRERWNIPTVIGNDANLAGLAEQRFGVGKGTTNLLFITISTGIGGGIVLNGEVYTGTSGFAGEIGHITVDTHGPYGRSRTPGAWESHCSGTALARIANERMAAGERSSLESAGGELDAIAIFDALRAGDALASSVVANAIEHMGTALTSVVNILDPEVIVIGGGLSNEWDSYIAPSVARMRELAFADMGKQTRVAPPALGIEAGALGAIALAAQP